MTRKKLVLADARHNAVECTAESVGRWTWNIWQVAWEWVPKQEHWNLRRRGTNGVWTEIACFHHLDQAVVYSQAYEAARRTWAIERVAGRTKEGG
jgi:hypothetical protein